VVSTGDLSVTQEWKQIVENHQVEIRGVRKEKKRMQSSMIHVDCVRFGHLPIRPDLSHAIMQRKVTYLGYKESKENGTGAGNVVEGREEGTGFLMIISGETKNFIADSDQDWRRTPGTTQIRTPEKPKKCMFLTQRETPGFFLRDAGQVSLDSAI
jgi:hypothetical protein